MQDLSATVSDRLDRVERATSREGLTTALADLAGSLDALFAAEEAQAPRDARRALKQAHGELRALVTAELDELRAENDGVWKEHGEARADIARRVRRHQEAHRDLLQA